MNFAMVVYIIGWLLMCEGGMMLLPALVAAIYRESMGVVFVAMALACAFIGAIMVFRSPKNKKLGIREGFVITALSWLVMSLMGCLPFFITGCIPNFIDALFETVSGFSTTGASILSDVEHLPHCMLFWRSFTHWIGGMGVLVLMLSLLPMAGGSQSSYMNLMKAESPGPQVEKLVPKIRSTATILYLIYIVLTILEFIILLLCGMPVFDAVCTAIGTAGTGGFGIKNDSIGGYSVPIQMVVMVFMVLFGINFNFYFFILLGKVKKAFSMFEVKVYLSVVAGAIILIAINITGYYHNFLTALQYSSFQVASLVSSTGFATADYQQWPMFSQTVLVFMMFMGACAGSTGGGIKVSRIVILVKTFIKEIRHLIHPSSVKLVTLDGKPVPHETVRSVNVYMVAFIMVYASSLVLISFDNFDYTTNFTAIVATLNNIGPGLGLVGPTGNFSIFSGFSKCVLIFDMLAGRLELFPVLIMFNRSTWKKF